MNYTLTYILGGEETFEIVNSRQHTNLAEYVSDLVVEQTGNPDACFTLTDADGNTILTEENVI